MDEQKVIWSKKAKVQLFLIMDYYAERNKSDTYSLKLEREIKLKLSKLDLSIALPQKTSILDLFYFTHKHIAVFFVFELNTITVKFVIDERRNPKRIEKLISDF